MTTCLRKLSRRTALTMVVAFVVVGFLHVQTPASEPARTLRFQDIDGNEHGWPSTLNKTTVLVFINTDCPIANSYHPALAKISDDFAGKNLDMVLIHANPQLSEKQARNHIREFSIQWPVALDPNQEIAQAVLARVTPEAFIVDKAGQVQYRGRIDDQHVALGKKRPKPTREDLRIAIEEVLAGKPVTVQDTKAVGCLIRFPK